MEVTSSGRSYARTYQGLRRRSHHELIEQAVRRSGGRVLTSTGPNRAPLFLGIEGTEGDRLGLCAYVFLANHEKTKNRPADEHRLQVRYGDVSDATWREQVHSLGFDPLGADVTLVLGAHLEADLIIGLDSLVYDPLPMGISIFFKHADIEQARSSGWHVWERDNISGVRRSTPRTEQRVETLLALKPERFLDYVRFERDALSLGFDPALRFRAAHDGAYVGRTSGLHTLERELSLSGTEILDIIGERPRLGMAVRGGVAERHLQRVLEADAAVVKVDLAQQEGPPDFFITLDGDRGRVAVECKNASPKMYADGTPKVETQKTRASKGDPKSRLYEPSQFDVVAACMFGPWGRWEFHYKRSELLKRDAEFPDRIAAIQRIDDTWEPAIGKALDA
jgi:hypothetical protein